MLDRHLLLDWAHPIDSQDAQRRRRRENRNPSSGRMTRVNVWKHWLQKWMASTCSPSRSAGLHRHFRCLEEAYPSWGHAPWLANRSGEARVSFIVGASLSTSDSTRLCDPLCGAIPAHRRVRMTGLCQGCMSPSTIRSMLVHPSGTNTRLMHTPCI